MNDPISNHQPSTTELSVHDGMVCERTVIGGMSYELWMTPQQARAKSRALLKMAFDAFFQNLWREVENMDRTTNPTDTGQN